MATFAAMIEILDDGIGEVIAATKEKGLYENTVFLFLSDNGSTNEGGFIAQLLADLNNTPYRSYKQWCFQGGTSTPFIVMYGDPQKNVLKGKFNREFSHIIDVMPTCLDMASVEYPGQFNDKKLSTTEGRSLIPAVQNKTLEPRDLFFEHQTSCAIISDGWKLVRNSGKQSWELIDLMNDPFEENDQAALYPEKVKALESKWNRWAEEKHVFPFEYRPWGERINYYKSLHPDQSGKD